MNTPSTPSKDADSVQGLPPPPAGYQWQVTTATGANISTTTWSGKHAIPWGNGGEAMCQVGTAGPLLGWLLITVGQHTQFAYAPVPITHSSTGGSTSSGHAGGVRQR